MPPNTALASMIAYAPATRCQPSADRFRYCRTRRSVRRLQSRGVSTRFLMPLKTAASCSFVIRGTCPSNWIRCLRDSARSRHAYGKPACMIPVAIRIRGQIMPEVGWMTWKVSQHQERCRDQSRHRPDPDGKALHQVEAQGAENQQHDGPERVREGDRQKAQIVDKQDRSAGDQHQTEDHAGASGPPPRRARNSVLSGCFGSCP